MGGFVYDDPCDRPYGPGNPDYEYERRRDEDLERQREADSRAVRKVCQCGAEHRATQCHICKAPA